MLKQEQQQAQADLITSLQKETQGDMANLMARYGSQLAFAGATSSPMVTPPVAPARGR